MERTEFHRAEADTLGIQTTVDTRLASWQQRMASLYRERISQYSEQQSSHDQQRELISETITTTTDSLGRAVRQEQRTISRDIQREQQQTVQRLEREMENRLQTALDRQDSIWQLRFSAAVVHWEQADSTRRVATPTAEDRRPWYRRWSDRLQWFVVGAVLAVALWITRRWWRKL